MAKKYDLIVVGGGPGGLIAAKTAAEDGLKVLLIERKRDITKVDRACLQTFYIDKLSGSWESEEGIREADGYIEPVSVEVVPEKGSKQTLKSKSIILATGSKPRDMPAFPFDGKKILGRKRALVFRGHVFISLLLPSCFIFFRWRADANVFC